MTQAPPPFDWEAEANREAPPQTEQLPTGRHDVIIDKVVYGKRDGPPFASKKGDPQIMVVFADAAGRQAAEMLTLSTRAGWKLAAILSAAGADIAKMKAHGIEPAHFSAQAFADANLIGRRLQIDVTWPEHGAYPDIVPVRRQAAAATAPAATPAPAAAQPPLPKF